MSLRAIAVLVLKTSGIGFVLSVVLVVIEEIAAGRRHTIDLSRLFSLFTALTLLLSVSFYLVRRLIMFLRMDRRSSMLLGRESERPSSGSRVEGSESD